MAPPFRSPLTARTWLRALVLQLFVLASFATGLHHMLEPHRLCVEHGVVEHGAPHAAVQASCAAEHDHDRDLPRLTRPVRSEVGHTACELLDMLVPHEQPSHVEIALAGPAGVRRSLPRHADPAGVGPARWLFAPKHSPPALL